MWVHSLLFATFPVLFLFAQNMGEFPVRVVLPPLAWAFLGGALFLGGARLFTKSLRDSALIASPFLFVGIFFGRISLALEAQEVVKLGLFFFTLSLLAGTVFLIRKFILSDSSTADSVSKIFLLVAVVLWTPSAFKIGYFALFQAQKDWFLLEFPSHRSPKRLLSADLEHPPIYHILLDAYGRSDTLKRYYNIDNSQFISKLKKLGFEVSAESRSNYTHTIASVASMFNMEYLTSFTDKYGRSTNDREPLRTAISKSKVRDLLSKKGYRFISFDSGFLATSIRNADLYLEPGHFNEFVDGLVAMLLGSPSHQLLLRQQNRLEFIFRKLKSLPTKQRYWVFAHLEAPHPPFVFQSDGSDANEGPFLGSRSANHLISPGGITRQQYKEQYENQLRWVNSEVIQVVQQLLKQNPKPIILIHGDHGPGAFYHHEDIEKTFFQDRFSVLLATYYPTHKPSLSSKRPLTLVNTYRYLFSRYFSEKLPLLENTYFYSSSQSAFDFIDVTQDIDTLGDRSKYQHLSSLPYFSED